MGTGLVILESSLVHIVHAGLRVVSEIVHKLSNIKFITQACLPLHRNPAYGSCLRVDIELVARHLSGTFGQVLRPEGSAVLIVQNAQLQLPELIRRRALERTIINQ